MTGPAIVAITPGGVDLARRIAAALGNAEVHGRAGRCPGADVTFQETVSHLAALFAAGRPIVAIAAAGIVIRALAPFLADKRSEPPVLAVSEDGSAVVPLLGGHRGANDLARRIAAALGATAAVTTASEAVLGVALDEPPQGWVLANPEHAPEFMRRLVGGEPVRLTGEEPWLDAGRLDRSDTARLGIVVTDEATEGAPDRLVYHPQTLALGIGAERGARPEEARALVATALADAGVSPHSVALVVSLDLKEDEQAVHSVAEMLGRPARFLTAGRLEAETPRLANPSATVFAAVGCHGVAEAAALAAAGPESVLIVEKRVGTRVTCAVARAPGPIDAATVGRPRAALAIVGLGPGGAGWRSAEASALVAAASDLVGYTGYLDLLGPPRPGQRHHGFALGEEQKRVAFALDLATGGRSVALISSGDPGIYAMAALAFETIEGGAAACRRIAVTVAPGISAVQAAAARAGAPLGHDFCAISLSDLMTPAHVIERRLAAAAEADFVVALYNPASRTRRGLLARALGLLARHRPAGTPVVVARALGRPGESVEVTSLEELDASAIDMLTVVIVGSSTTRSFARGDGGLVVYTPRGYGIAGGARAPRKAAS